MRGMSTIGYGEGGLVDSHNGRPVLKLANIVRLLGPLRSLEEPGVEKLH